MSNNIQNTYTAVQSILDVGSTNTLCSEIKSLINITFPANFQKHIPQFIVNDENSTTTSKKTNFELSIQQWVLKFRSLLSQQAINELLQICLDEGGYNFPKDSRTFIKTPKKCENIVKGKIISVVGCCSIS